MIACVWALQAGGSGWAADLDLALETTRLVESPERTAAMFGASVSGGDLDGDGYSELIVGGRDQVTVAFGSPAGIRAEDVQVVTQQHDHLGLTSFYGAGLASGDLDGDGAAELLVGAPEAYGGVFMYNGGPAGVSLQSELLLTPLDPGTNAYAFFGYSLEIVGDVNGDGAPETLVGAPYWSADPDQYYVSGAAFLYYGDGNRADRCSEVRIEAPTPMDTTDRDQNPRMFGYRVTGAGDLNGDGFADLAVSCPRCYPAECHTCGTVNVWLGGTEPTFGADVAFILTGNLPPPEGVEWDYFGWGTEAAGDVNGDDFDDLVIGSTNGAFIAWGGAEGPGTAPERVSEGNGFLVAGAGDLDEDGYDDLVSSWSDLWIASDTPASASVLFGSRNGVDAGSIRVQPENVIGGDGFGEDLASVGDVNGDGRPEFAAGAMFEGADYGAAYVFSPACTWYADSDADGHGDPNVSVASCHEQIGYVSRADDCDDTDASVQGSVWYPDLDGDGHGAKTEGVLACDAPTGSVATRFDCDDADATRFPGTADDTVDGIDQDCDGHDGAWVFDTGDCPSGTGMAPGDTSDDDALDTAANPTSNGEQPTGDDPAANDCGCATSSSPWPAAAVTAGLLWLRRRSGPPQYPPPMNK